MLGFMFYWGLFVCCFCLPLGLGPALQPWPTLVNLHECLFWHFPAKPQMFPQLFLLRKIPNGGSFAVPSGYDVCAGFLNSWCCCSQALRLPLCTEFTVCLTIWRIQTAFRFSVPFLPPHHFWYLPFPFLTTLAFLGALALQVEGAQPLSLSPPSLPPPLAFFFHFFSIIINI